MGLEATPPGSAAGDTSQGYAATLAVPFEKLDPPRRTKNDGRAPQATDPHHTNSSRAYTRCTTTPLVSAIRANGDIALCILKRDMPETKIGSIYDGPYSSQWGSARHAQLIREINLAECPSPCKRDSYNIVVEALSENLLHHNSV